MITMRSLQIYGKHIAYTREAANVADPRTESDRPCLQTEQQIEFVAHVSI